MEPPTNAYSYGQTIGDVVTTAQGIVEMGVGATATTGGTIGGIVTSPTGVGALAGGAIASGGVAVTAHGSTVATQSVHNLLFAKGSKKSGKQRATDIPSWAKGEKPKAGESGKDFAKRLLDEKYGAGNYPTGPNSEYNKIKKHGDRNK